MTTLQLPALRFVACFIGSLCGAELLLAQAAPTAANTPASEEVIRLTVFEVSAEASRGYVTTSSLAASRVAVPITELPATVITINEQFIADTAARTLRDTFNYISGVNMGNQGTGTQTQNSVSIRGYTVSSAQRDGVADRIVSSTGGFDYALVERIEVVKGPSGVLYGSHTPGGVVNFISKRPLLKPQTRISASVGSYSTYRTELDTSGFIDRDRRFGYRFSGAWSDTDGPLDFPGEPSGGLQVYNPSFSYRAHNGLEVWAWAAFVRDGTNRLAYTAHAYQTGPASGRVLFREAQLAHGNNIFQNLSQVDTDTYELGASKTFELGPIGLDARVLARRYDQSSIGDRVRGVGAQVDLFLDASGNVLGTDSRTTDYAVVNANLVSIARGQIRYDNVQTVAKGDLYTVDLNFRFDIGPTKHRLLAYAVLDDSDTVSGNDAYTVNNTAKLVALGAKLVGTQTRIQVWPTPAPEMQSVSPSTVVERADVRALNTNLSSNELSSYGAIERMSFLDDRFFLVGGVRKDDLKATSMTFLNGVQQAPTRPDDSSTTYSYAALVKVYQGRHGLVSGYYNNNETFVPEYGLDRRLGPTLGQRFPNRYASTEEFGLKVDLLDSRIVSTLSIFDTLENNMLQSFPDNDGSVTGVPVTTYQAPVGSRHTEGWDIDLNVAPAPGWEFMVSYARIASRISSTNLPAEAQPRDTFSVVGRYAVQDGGFKGLSLMWLYSYWGDSVLGSRTNWALPGGDIHTAVVGYRWRNWDVRVRVENVFDNLSTMPSTFETAVGVTHPRNYRFALSYTF